LLGLCGAVLVSSVAATAGEPAAGPWTQFRGPNGLGISAEKGLPVSWVPQQGIAWKADLPGAGASTPIFLGDRIFLTCYSGYAVPGEPRGDLSRLKRHVVCLSRRDGRALWNKTVPAKMPEQPTIREHGYAANSMFTDGARAYAFLGSSGVFAFDLDGKQLWQANVGSKTNGWGTAASPIRYSEMLIINASVESESLIALDRQTGKEKWHAGGIKESWNTPILHEGHLYWAHENDGILLCVEAKTGRVVYEERLPRAAQFYPSPVLADGRLYYTSRDGRTYVVAAKPEFELLATNELGRAGTFNASPAVANGQLFLRADKVLFCMGEGK
jgi:hypothetical protein